MVHLCFPIVGCHLWYMCAQALGIGKYWLVYCQCACCALQCCALHCNKTLLTIVQLVISSFQCGSLDNFKALGGSCNSSYKLSSKLIIASFHLSNTMLAQRFILVLLALSVLTSRFHLQLP